MKLHNDKELFKTAIVATAQFLGIKEVFVEKDYWVTYALYTIFNSEIENETVFKGGTALSKCYKLIERFSEDIDIVVFRRADESDNQLKSKIRTISKILGNAIPEINIPGLTNKMGNIRKTVHNYQKEFSGRFGQISENVILEVSWMGSSEPNSSMKVSSYIFDMMVQQKKFDLIDIYRLSPFNIRVLSKYRTFCEKIMSLVRFSNTNNPIFDLRNKIRHFYDLNQMLKDKDIQIFLHSHDFEKMLIKTGQDDIVSYKNNNEWLLKHPADAICFSKIEETWKDLRSVYYGNFQDIVIGVLPHESDIIESITIIYKRLKNISWDLNK